MFLSWNLGGKSGAVVRTLTSHQCGPGSNPRVDAKCGLVLSFAQRGFSLVTYGFPLSSKTNIFKFQFEKLASECATAKSLIIIFYLADNFRGYFHKLWPNYKGF